MGYWFEGPIDNTKMYFFYVFVKPFVILDWHGCIRCHVLSIFDGDGIILDRRIHKHYSASLDDTKLDYTFME